MSNSVRFGRIASTPGTRLMEPAALDQLDQSLRGADPGGALDRLADDLAARGEFRGLLDALLLRARWDLGLPLVRPGTLGDLAEPTRTRYEDRYVAALRRVGALILDSGEIAAAWPYFRAIGEPEPIVAAIDRFAPEANDGPGERVNEVIDVALGQGVHPTRGFDLVLEHHGTCTALSSVDSLPSDEATRRHAADRLTRRLHADLRANLRAELTRRGQPVPPDDAPLPRWIDGRPWLFADDGYHLDTSHLALVVRLSPLLTDPAAIRLARELCHYGQQLAPLLQPDGEPPFDDFYADHAVYLDALVSGDDAADAGVAHFRGKLTPPGDPFDRDAPVLAQTLVRLLDRLGQTEAAFLLAAEHLAGLPDGALGEPTLAGLGLRLGRLDRLAALARDGADPVRFAAIRLEQFRAANG